MTASKRQYFPDDREPGPPGLWVVATPIGNLGDLTPRALAALEKASVVLCEDTRRTQTLASALGLNLKLQRLDAHASERAVQSAVERMLAGETLALVTDAGTPAISDPGAALVAAARRAGVRVTPLPGASAVMTLLSMAGFEETAFTFRGFFPRKDPERKKELDLAAKSKTARAFVWFESPERIGDALETIAAHCPAVEAIAAKELTKLHERSFSGSAAEVSEAVRAEIDREGKLGEWGFALKFPPQTEDEAAPEAEDAGWVKALACLMDAQIPASDAARRVSQYFGVARKRVYDEALKISGKK